MGPVAPQYLKLPYSIILLIVAGALIFSSGQLEIFRAQVVTNIINTGSSQTANYVDAQINFANALNRNGQQAQAAAALQIALNKVRTEAKPDKAAEIRLMACMAENQFEAGDEIVAHKTTKDLLAKLNPRILPTVPMPVVWQLDGLAKALCYTDNRTRLDTDQAIAIWLGRFEQRIFSFW